MNQKEITQKVTELVAAVLETEQEKCQPAVLLKDLGATEFDMVELVMKLEDQFNVIIDDADMVQLDTIAAVAQYLCDKK